ncbi:MAG: ABC transporter substrate-binding protein [Candidatus Azobacteroides sp.]|nr:ABC transporter substrate-binding protein [Candidatus Azobacteroides sp.]
MDHKIHGLIFFLFSFLLSCGNNTPSGKNEDTPVSTDSIKYAQGFTIERFDNYTCISVRNMLDNNRLYGKYYLYRENDTPVPDDGTKVHIPLKSLAAASATHFEFLNLIGELDKVTGICEAFRVYNPMIREKVKNGEITDLGDSFNLNFEKLLGLKPDAIMVSGYEQQDENQLRISRSGIPVLYNNEWMEKELLGRAEWIKFVAAFFDKSAEAERIFNEIEKKYLQVTSLTKEVKEKPKVMSGNDFRGTWYVPGGKSYVAELYRNGGASYAFMEDASSGSLPLTFEAALKAFSSADIWLWCSYNSMQELKTMSEKNTLFKAYKNGEVYNNLNRSTPEGGNDFWESAVARPDILLQDVIKVIHPSLLPDHTLFYLKKIE